MDRDVMPGKMRVITPDEHIFIDFYDGFTFSTIAPVSKLRRNVSRISTNLRTPLSVSHPTPSEMY